MGEDRTMCAEKKNEVTTYPCRHRHSSVISSCSEDAESESTSAGYPPSPDEERDEELEYGPGIVNKLRTRFLSITLKQNRGTNMRRSCSMENLLDQDRPLGRPFPTEKAPDSAPVKPPWGNLKRAKSMDTLLMEMHPEVDDHKAPKVVKSGLGGRLMPTICDEELPKPDTVKTYKRMFEPAESRRGTHCRRPPVLRASARSTSGSKVNGVTPTPSAKVNGTSRSKFSAKQSPPVKAQSPDLFHPVNGSGKKSPSQESPKPMFNGVVKATPVKISSLRNGREVENLNSINRLLNKKEVHFAPKTDIICNGNMNHKDILKIKSNEDNVKQFTKNSLTNGNVKPKVPPNRPSLRSPKPLLKINEHTSQDVLSPTKLKPILANGLRKSCEINNKSDLPKSPEPKSNDLSRIPREFHLKNRIKSPPLESKPKEDFVWPPELKSKDTDKMTSPTEKYAGTRIPPESEIKTEAIPTPEKKVKDIIQTLSESSVVKNDTQPQEKEPISKLTERTATISPDLNNLDKTFKAPTVLPPKVPLMQQFNTTTELVNGFVDTVKKPTNEFVDPLKKPSNEFVDPVKKSTNGFVDPVKKSTNEFVDPVKKPANGFVDPVKKPVNGFVDPVKKPMNGSAMDKSPNKTPSPSQPEKKPGSLEPARRSPVNGLPTTETAKKPLANGFTEPAGKVSKQPSHDSPDGKPGPSRPIKKSQAQSTSMVFDFRGKDVVPHVAVLPVPFGCKALHPKKRAETPEEEDEDEDYVDYSVPPPSGVVFEGENIKIGKGSILAIRNKDLKITFDDDVDGNTFVYPSETSLLEDSERSPSTSTNEVIPNGQPPPNNKLKTNTSIGSSSAGGLSTYTPSVLRTMDNFEPGMTVRSPAAQGDKEPADQGQDDLKPADPDLIASWSLSAGTSDLLF